MLPPTSHQNKTRLVRSVQAMTVAYMMCTMLIACSSMPRHLTVIHENLLGSVYLEEIPDPSFQTTHPISLGPAVIARILHGVRVQDQQRLLQTVIAGDPSPAHAFSDADAEFLSPLLSTALYKATSDQRVGFRVFHNTAAGSETTGGFLYTHGRSLHFTLTHFRYNAERLMAGSKPGRQLPDPTGLNQRQVLFVPEAAKRSSIYEQPASSSEPPLATIVIDYELLAKLSVPQPAPAQAPDPDRAPETDQGSHTSLRANSAASSKGTEATMSEELRSVKELVIRKDMELEALKEEVRALQRRLDEREAEPPKPKSRKPATPLQKSAH